MFNFVRLARSRSDDQGCLTIAVSGTIPDTTQLSQCSSVIAVLDPVPMAPGQAVQAKSSGSASYACTRGTLPSF